MQSAGDHIICVTDLCFSRNDKKIFSGINLAIRRHAVTAIMGPSGTGKTTLLKFIGGQLRASQGQVCVNGKDIAQFSKAELQQMRRNMGLLFQEGALFTDLTVYENVAFLLREHTALPEDMIHDLVLLKLEAVGLRGAYSLMINELSGGMARRVALARAIMLDPQLMMYDEPFAGQDPINRGVLTKLIRELNDALGMTSVLVSHDVNEVIAVADWVYVIADGRVIGDGKPSELMDSDDPMLQQFVQGLPDGPVSFAYPAKDIQQEFSA